MTPEGCHHLPDVATAYCHRSFGRFGSCGVGALWQRNGTYVVPASRQTCGQQSSTFFRSFLYFVVDFRTKQNDDH
jgi:hypothetical protein